MKHETIVAPEPYQTHPDEVYISGRGHTQLECLSKFHQAYSIEVFAFLNKKGAEVGLAAEHLHRYKLVECVLQTMQVTQVPSYFQGVKEISFLADTRVLFTLAHDDLKEVEEHLRRLMADKHSA